MGSNNNINLFKFINQITMKKNNFKVSYNMNLSEIKTDNKNLKSIFQYADTNKDNKLSATELSKLNELINFADTQDIKGATKNNGIFDEKEMQFLAKQLKKGKIDFDNIPEPTANKPSSTPWSEGLNRKITSITIAEEGFKDINNFKAIKEELIDIGNQEGFSVTQKRNGNSWTEDSSINRADGKVYTNYYSYTDIHNNFTVVNDFQDDNKKNFGFKIGGQGAVAKDSSNTIAGNSINSKDKHIGTSYLEGGNVLQTLKSDGNPGAVIGSMSIAYTMSAMGLENTPQNIELAKKTIAQDLGIKQENLTFIPQDDFHIDMRYRPLNDGEIAVPDYDSSIKFLEDKLKSNDPALDKQSPGDYKKTLREDYTNMLKNIKEKKEESAGLLEKANQELINSGYKIVKVPCFDNGTNFMNAVGGTSKKDGAKFLITNKSDYPEINTLVSNTYKNYGIERVHFVSTQGALEKLGGIDCLTSER